MGLQAQGGRLQSEVSGGDPQIVFRHAIRAAVLLEGPRRGREDQHAGMPGPNLIGF